jgi:hypothetical protein
MADFYGPVESPSLEEFANRFPEWVVGRAIWRGWLLEGRWRQRSDLALDELIDALRRYAGSVQTPCPRVFVSHRRHDSDAALRIAELAQQAGFEFWLDVLDPHLQWLAAVKPASPPAYFILVASIIEIALLNSSHVIAVLSKETRGTLWVPYEYGRVKEKLLHSRRAAVWLNPDIPPDDIPDYTVLGVATPTEAEISAWYTAELGAWCTRTGQCCSGAGNAFKGGQTTALLTPDGH